MSSEASSWAGHQQLGNLVLIYDANHISIEDDTDVALSEDTAGYGSAGCRATLSTDSNSGAGNVTVWSTNSPGILPGAVGDQGEEFE